MIGSWALAVVRVAIVLPAAFDTRAAMSSSFEATCLRLCVCVVYVESLLRSRGGREERGEEGGVMAQVVYVVRVCECDDVRFLQVQ